ncbi:inositol-tetrakisphosphate 1-kinase-like [Adelges cooleyi]|uniref:inositol-tetrakisphosphate 1-kinase-like n=1 Tax=Adelges cooleyi TaxID=133065 RepID=UPI0021806B56|nr:inositol-tetrakisphosphate 1-kinase-like [Adelges cooleyi]
MTDNKKPSPMVIGYWMSDRKSQKLNWVEFGKVCRKHGYELVKLDLDKPLENQGPFAVILHKLTEIIARKDEQAVQIIGRIEQYIKNHPKVLIIDPLDSVRTLLDRFKTYSVVLNTSLNNIDVFTPTFVEILSNNVEENIKKLKNAGVTFPFICKPYVAQGTTYCHQMSVIFNECGVADCKPPCVAQSFINHNAVLYKIYVVGDHYQVVERPSLKNFYPSNEDKKTITFDSHSVSKSDSSSELSVLDPSESAKPSNIDPIKLHSIVKTISSYLNMSLYGIDIVVENNTNRHAIIDINAYPGYDGFPDFFGKLIDCVMTRLAQSPCNNKTYFEDSGFDTSDSSDEKKSRAKLVSMH